MYYEIHVKNYIIVHNIKEKNVRKRCVIKLVSTFGQYDLCVGYMFKYMTSI